VAAFLAVAQARAAGPIPAEPAPVTGHWRDASLDEYRKHLQDLTTLVESCAKVRDAKTCDPAQVGADDRIPLGDAAHAERRMVRYDWLRLLLVKAQEKDQNAGKSEFKPVSGGPAEESAVPSQRITAELLQDAATRLAQDLAESNAAIAVTPAHGQERDAMKQVLAGRDFRNLEDPSVRNAVLEKLGNWLNHLFAGIALLSARAAWVGRLIVWGFVLAVCIGLVWGLIQFERRWRIRLVPEVAAHAAGAASARDWQLWLEDARKAAAASQWREAVHFLYWAAISRLESRRLWPADRARTPREYLALVAPEDPRRAGLASLTGSFERIWYGGRAAAESDYRHAEQLASALISASGSSLTRGGLPR
jgi:hypothetical protein